MIKQKLIDARKNKSFSQQKMADALSMTVANYNRRENGSTKISTENWQKLADILETPLEKIYEAEESQVFIFNDNAR
jgi:transcriptional regulator with XRE-family HTH domain